MKIAKSQMMRGPYLHYSELHNKGAYLVAQVVKESACNAGGLGLIPGLGRSPREGNGNPLQYSCLGNSLDRGAWGATVHEVTKLNTLSN